MLHSLPYYNGETKHYYLPLSSSIESQANGVSDLGIDHPDIKSENEIANSILKAKKGRFSHFKIPWQSPSRLNFIKDQVNENGLGLIVQLSQDCLDDEIAFDRMISLDREIEFEIIIAKPLKKSSLVRLDELINQDRNFFCTIPVSFYQSLKQVVSSLEGRLTEIHLYFPYQAEGDGLSSRQIFSLIKKMKRFWPDISFYPPKGSDVWDFRVGEQLNLEAFYNPCFETQSSHPQIEFSVIIPSFNNANYIYRVIDQLKGQNVGLDRFEVIVVDDGSSDATQVILRELVQSLRESMNFKYIYFPRQQTRYMGDGQYRAGIARNLGAKNASGSIFCFLDSDILVPDHYLSVVKEALRKFQGVQARRRNINQWISQDATFHYDNIKKRHLIPDEKYWEEFNDSPQPWSERDCAWKYVCTHSFSIHSQDFWRLGGLKRNYIFYGFEDTDLGYRLLKGGGQLGLLDLNVYHLYHEEQRSEFSNNYYKRHRLLKKTAQIFYRHHLDEEIYHNLQIFLWSDFNFKKAGWWLLRKLTLGDLWWPSTRYRR